MEKPLWRLATSLFNSKLCEKLFLSTHIMTDDNLRVTPITFFIAVLDLFNSQPAITCSKLAIETLEQGVKHAQSSQ